MRRNNGFTLIELLVVLAIASLVAALALPQLSGAQTKADLRTTARAIAAGLRIARNAAMTRGRAEAFSVDVAHGAFRAGSGAAVQPVAKAIHLVLVTATEERIDADSGDIRFFPDGTSTGGGIALSEGDRRAEVLVDWLTGRISIGGASDAARR
jgi:general secretion pathway protein H